MVNGLWRNDEPRKKRAMKCSVKNMSFILSAIGRGTVFPNSFDYEGVSREKYLGFSIVIEV